MTLSRINHLGAAASTTLNGSITAGATSATLSGTVTGYPTANFVIKIDAGTASEEKILVGSRTGSTLSSLTRAYDGTAASSHSSGAAVEHDLAAVVIDDANDHVYTTSRDDHTQYARTDGTRAITGKQTFSAGANITASGLSVVGGVSSDTVTASSGGSTAASRYVGATTAGAPTTGTYLTGDWIVDQNGVFWVCTAGGTPGTWTSKAGQIYCEAWRNATDGSFTGGNIPFDSSLDPNGNYSIASTQYTVPVNGFYAISAAIEGMKLGTAGTSATLQLMLNGGTVLRDLDEIIYAGGSTQALYGSTHYYLSAGGLISVQVSGTVVAGLTAGRASTYMTIALISAH